MIGYIRNDPFPRILLAMAIAIGLFLVSPTLVTIYIPGEKDIENRQIENSTISQPQDCFIEDDFWQLYKEGCEKVYEQKVNCRKRGGEWDNRLSLCTGTFEDRSICKKSGGGWDFSRNTCRTS